MLDYGDRSGLSQTRMAKSWERAELMLAVELYCETPFGRIHSRNPEIIRLAEALDRTPSSVAMKMVNFAALDTTVPQKGLSSYSKKDAEIWEEFFANPSEFLDRVTSIRGSMSDLIAAPIQPTNHQWEVREGEDIVVSTKQRRNQDFFRRTILAAYGNKCAVTGISNPKLLTASHIIGWAEDEGLRLNPSNGICLNALHDRAFDRKLISFEDDGTLIVFKQLEMNEQSRPFFEGKKLAMPDRFAPSQELLARHRDACLKAA